MVIRRFFYFVIIISIFTECNRTLEDRAAEECKEYTEKKCPTPVVDNTRLDSMVFERSTRTIHYYHSLIGDADNKHAIASQKGKLRKALCEALRADPETKVYKDAGFNFRYTYHSGKKPTEVLIDMTYTPKDFGD
ncbi:hypothetical protein KZY63_00695 [Prevotella histicola]|jgi:putative lipoprotein|uniref:hypothetical protein n=1 Tax=Prevotella histicola TaxID=470565 RepID=UPI001C603F6C|nr:hypothetical protein [Prevotella histicola]MBW4710975.1 hypothetical protein [Prevotella histicola]MBW4875763.1 hypothetical protein [Prevotella histicola]MBW4919773.1 hypothetical protein [Prevotella histicola]